LDASNNRVQQALLLPGAEMNQSKTEKAERWNSQGESRPSRFSDREVSLTKLYGAAKSAGATLASAAAKRERKIKLAFVVSLLFVSTLTPSLMAFSLLP
jgi:hypothetical protein